MPINSSNPIGMYGIQIREITRNEVMDMTTIEHMMLTSVFGCVWGWIIGSIIFIVADLIHIAIRKYKNKREKKRHEVLMTQNKKTTK